VSTALRPCCTTHNGEFHHRAAHLSRLSTRLSMPRLMAIGGWPPSSASHCSPHLSTTTIIVAALPLGTTWTFQHSLLQTRSTSVLPQARGTAVGPFVGGLFAEDRKCTRLNSSHVSLSDAVL